MGYYTGYYNIQVIDRFPLPPSPNVIDVNIPMESNCVDIYVIQNYILRNSFNRKKNFIIEEDGFTFYEPNGQYKYVLYKILYSSPAEKVDPTPLVKYLNNEY